MPSLVAHSLVGAGVFIVAMPKVGTGSLFPMLWSKRREFLFFIIIANLPDFDMIMSLLLYSNGEAFHGLYSHSLFAALLLALAASLIYPMGNRWKTFLASFILMVFHDLMDFAASPNLRDPGTGIWLFFPLTERIASPFPLFFGVRHSSLEQLFSIHNLRTIGFEILIFGLIVFIIYSISKSIMMSGRIEGGEASDKCVEKDGKDANPEK